MPKPAEDNANFWVNALAHFGVVSPLLDRIVNSRDADLSESETPRDIHRSYYMLMFRVSVGTDRQW